MASSHKEVYAQAIGLGAVAGLRALMAPALLSYKATMQAKKTDSRRNYLSSPKVSALLGALAVGELIGDKLPGTPPRTAPVGLAARAASGAFVGGNLCAAKRKPIVVGAALGAAAAIAAAYVGMNTRLAFGRQLGVPDAVVGAIEDALAVGGGLAVLKNK